MTTNTQGFGTSYLKMVAGQMRVSLALKQDAKVQKRYLQAQINELSDKMVEAAARQTVQDKMNEEFDRFMRQF